MTKRDYADEDALLRRAAALYHRREQEFDADPQIRDRLLRARKRAVAAAASRQPRGPRWMPVAAMGTMAAAVAMVGLMIWQGVLTPVPLHPEPYPVSSLTASNAPVPPHFLLEDPAILELLTADESWDLYRDLDFFAALDEEF